MPSGEFLNSSLLNELSACEGKGAVWIESLVTGDIYIHNADMPLQAASVIKLIIMLSAFEAIHDGKLNGNASYRIRETDKMPSCGALTYMHSDLNVTYFDLITLMIILSDNTATNILIDKLGIDYINGIASKYNLSDMMLRRRLFDDDAASRGIKNTVTARSAASFFRKLYRKELVDEASSDKMLEILLSQRLNGKIPFFLEGMGIRTAHKTGEDDGITHDVGIIYSDTPLIAVFLSNETNVPRFERFIQDAAKHISIR